MQSACCLKLSDLSDAHKYAQKVASEGTARRAESLYFLALCLHGRGQWELAWHYATCASAVPKPNVLKALFTATDIYLSCVAESFTKIQISCAEKIPEKPYPPEELHTTCTYQKGTDRSETCKFFFPTNSVRISISALAP